MRFALYKYQVRNRTNPKRTVAGIAHKGAVIHHQDQSITLPSLSPRKSRNRPPKKLIPPDAVLSSPMLSPSVMDTASSSRPIRFRHAPSLLSLHHVLRIISQFTEKSTRNHISGVRVLGRKNGTKQLLQFESVRREPVVQARGCGLGRQLRGVRHCDKK